jgi:putative ABC transport system permease protein
MGQHLIEGRLLNRQDADQQNLLAVIVDRAWARRFFPNESALGKRLKAGGCTECPWTTVVGVVSDVKFDGLDQPTQGTVYFPLADQQSRYLVVRTKGDPSRELATIGRIVRELDPSVPLSQTATAQQLIDQSLERPQALSLLIASFAAVALLLATVGIYGVMGYYVQQHMKEISIRIALGGSRADVGRLVVGQGMIVVIVGVVVGTSLAFAATRLMASLLFNVGAADMTTFTAVSALMTVVALLACALPAWRAMRVEPAVVLRND